VRLFGVVTSYGSPWWIVKVFAGDAGRMALMRGMKPLCAKEVQSFYLAHYAMDSSTPQSRQAFLEKVRRRIAAIA
jgi:NAD(P)H dehydrogenase (quinone)